MVGVFAMKRAVPAPTKRKPDADFDWVKTPYPNLIRYKPSGNYFGRVRVNGKLIRHSLKTHVLSVAKLKLSDFLQDHRRLAIADFGGGNAFEFPGAAVSKTSTD